MTEFGLPRNRFGQPIPDHDSLPGYERPDNRDRVEALFRQHWREKRGPTQAAELIGYTTGGALSVLLIYATLRLAGVI